MTETDSFFNYSLPGQSYTQVNLLNITDVSGGEPVFESDDARLAAEAACKYECLVVFFGLYCVCVYDVVASNT